MSAPDDRALRAETARWFLDHDEVDEAARALAPGDELELGQSAYLDLAAALARRGLAAIREEGRVRVSAESGLAEPRKPPARTTPAPLAHKKTA